MKTVIICVNYNSYRELEAYIRSIETASQKSEGSHLVLIIVADNSDPKERLRHEGPLEVRQIFTGGNPGYFGGAAKGIEASGSDLKEYDYIVISNADLLLSEDFFVKLYEEKTEHDVGCIAPSIISVREGTDRNPKVLERYSAGRLKMLRLMFRFPILWKTYTHLLHGKRRKRIQRGNLAGQDIYAAHGSFMLFTNRSADFLQTMKFPAFLFGEELFIAENLRIRGLRTIYMPQLVVRDIDHVSTANMKKSFYFRCNYESLGMILRDYYGE